MDFNSIYASILQSMRRAASPEYDYAGYTKKYGPPDQSKGQHLTDEFKLPGHITFSDESIYSNPQQQGGMWRPVMGKWTFYPSEFNLQQRSPERLVDYFRDYEPDSRLVLPPQYDQYRIESLRRLHGK